MAINKKALIPIYIPLKVKTQRDSWGFQMLLSKKVDLHKDMRMEDVVISAFECYVVFKLFTGFMVLY